MNTTFSLRLRGLDEATARGMARECFDQLDFLETQLSRFIEGSDVSRINQMQAGETLYLSETCHQCLLLALRGLRQHRRLVRHHARHAASNTGSPAAAARCRHSPAG